MRLTDAKASLKRTAFLLVVSLLIGCGGGGGGGGGNNAPVANAGPDQSVTTGTVVTLNGSASSDADSDPLTYAWTFTSKPGGSSVVLSSATVVNPTFTPDVAGSYVLTLVVNDGQVDSAPDTVTITASVGNAPPVANAGPDQSVTTGTVVTLDGSASSDANSDPLTYAWTLTSRPGGSSAVLSSATAVHPTFTPDVAGSYVLTLVVNDGQVNSAPDTVTITASGAAPEVTTLAASSLGTTTATLNGNVTANGLPTEAWFEWGTDENFVSYAETSHQSIDSEATSQPVIEALSGLTPVTTYYYRIAARNDLGTTRGGTVFWVSF